MRAVYGGGHVGSQHRHQSPDPDGRVAPRHAPDGYRRIGSGPVTGRFTAAVRICCQGGVIRGGTWRSLAGRGIARGSRGVVGVAYCGGGFRGGKTVLGRTRRYSYSASRSAVGYVAGADGTGLHFLIVWFGTLCARHLADGRSGPLSARCPRGFSPEFVARR